MARGTRAAIAFSFLALATSACTLLAPSDDELKAGASSLVDSDASAALDAASDAATLDGVTPEAAPSDDDASSIDASCSDAFPHDSSACLDFGRACSSSADCCGGYCNRTGKCGG
jgi:hypothetical protein